MSSSAYIDLVKETAYEIWQKTHKTFCAVDIFNEVWPILKSRGINPPTAKAVKRILDTETWAKPKRKSGGTYATYVWTGD